IRSDAHHLFASVPPLTRARACGKPARAVCCLIICTARPRMGAFIRHRGEHCKTIFLDRTRSMLSSPSQHKRRGCQSQSEGDYRRTCRLCCSSLLPSPPLDSFPPCVMMGLYFLTFKPMSFRGVLTLPLVKVKEKFQVTIPTELRQALHLAVGDL